MLSLYKILLFQENSSLSDSTIAALLAEDFAEAALLDAEGEEETDLI